ncbi:MAG: hypothetical protein J6Q53_06375 [Oscillospiraceae bacterium]|nr:hypothetical protein [Oscillospiraceae bacterium]
MKRRLTLYDNAVLFLMYWVIFQDIMLPLVYKFTGMASVTSVLFYLKDLMMIGLFVAAVFTRRIERHLMSTSLLYLAGFAATFVITLLREVPLMNALQSGRGMLLMPVFLCIGSAISNKSDFRDVVIHRYFPVLLVSVLFGIGDWALDKLIGTKEIWRTGIGLTDFLVDIKHQAPYMIEGLPGNFYGSYGNDFFSVKRLVGFWAGPLTAAYSLLLPMLFYYFDLHEELKPGIRVSRLPKLAALLLLVIGVYLTRTRAILLLGLLMIGLYSVHHYRKNMRITLLGVIGVIVVLSVMDYGALWRFLYDGSTAGHILSIIDAVNNTQLSVFGQGFAYVGIYGSIGSENTYLSLLGNMGLWGLCLYVFIFARQILLCGAAGKKGNSFDRAVFYTGMAMAASGMISEQLTAFTTIAPVYILLGAVGSAKEREVL